MSDWINKCFLRNVLHGDEQIIDIRVESATKKGDNYGSDMYRVAVDISFDEYLYTKGFIVKAMPSGEIQQKIMIDCNIFPREMFIYDRIIPEIKNLLRCEIGDNTQFEPRCFDTLYDPKPLLVFEDLKMIGYKNLNRQNGLDYSHAKLVLTRLAKLHACSAVLYRKKPSLMNIVLEGVISDNPKRQDFLIYYKLSIRTLVKVLRQMNNTPMFLKIIDKLAKLEDKMVPKLKKVYQRDDKAFNVFNHGDLWSTNFMFKYTEKGKVTDVRFFDYQLSYFGSPGVDLSYFLYGSLQEQTREQYFKQLVAFYYKTLKKTLEKLNYSKIPSLRDIEKEITDKGIHGVNAAVCLVPLTMIEDTENAEMDIFLQESEEGEAFRTAIHSNPKYIKFIVKLLERFDSLGYLD